MLKILMLQGLPGSGKSTYARQLIEENANKNRHWTRVNNDDLRESFHNGRWTKGNEKLITTVRDLAIEQALADGFHVVVDNLNLHPKHEIQLQKTAERLGAAFEKKFFDTPVEECIKRDLKRPNSVGRDVILRWHNDYLAPKETYTPPEGKPQAIIVDIDGTLAHMTGRSPYDYSRVAEDAVDPTVKEVVESYHQKGFVVIICSGREDGCRDVTYRWLVDNEIPFDHLYMRKAEDRRDDRIIKREIFDEHIRDHYNVYFVLDDRNRVVQMWRSLGLKVLQVADGDF